MKVTSKLLLSSASLALAACGMMSQEREPEPEPSALGGAAAGAALGTVVSGGALAPAIGAVGGAVVAEEAADKGPMFGEAEARQPAREPIAANVEREPVVREGPKQRAAAGDTAPDVGPVFSPQLVSKVQQQLNDSGFDAGPVDGIYGPLTERAVRNFQQAKPDLEATGNLTVETLAALGILGAGEASASAGGTTAQNQKPQ